MTILGHYRSNFLQKSISRVIWKYFKVSEIFHPKNSTFFSLSKLLDVGLELDEKFDPFFDPSFKIEKYLLL